MKKNTTPELNQKWWTGNAPDGLDGKELGKALGDYETALAKIKKDGPENNLSACLKALDQVVAAARKAQGDAEKNAKSPPKKGKATAEDYANTAEALKKYTRVVDAARKDLDVTAKAAAEEEAEEDEDEAGAYGTVEAYQGYLKKVLKRLKQKPMNFAVGIGKKPDEHRFVFHRQKPGKALTAEIKKATALKRFTWGIAGGHEERPTVLVLGLEGPQAPGLKKKAEKQLMLLKPLPFNKVMLMVEGEEAEDLVDPEDDIDEALEAETTEETKADTVDADAGKAFAARLKALLPKVQQLVAAKSPQGNDAKLKASEAGVLARKQDFAGANRLLDEIDVLVGAGATEAPPRAQPASKVVFTQSRLAWVAARTKVHGELKKLEDAILDTYKDEDVFSEVQSAVRKLDSILENFDESLADKLDEALNATDEAEHARLHGEARGIIQRYRRFLDSDPLVRDIDGNPFVPLTVHATIDKTLSVLESKLT